MYFIVYLTYTITYNAAKIQNNIENRLKNFREKFSVSKFTHKTQYILGLHQIINMTMVSNSDAEPVI